MHGCRQYMRQWYFCSLAGAQFLVNCLDILKTQTWAHSQRHVAFLQGSILTSLRLIILFGYFLCVLTTGNITPFYKWLTLNTKMADEKETCPENEASRIENKSHLKVLLRSCIVDLPNSLGIICKYTLNKLLYLFFFLSFFFGQCIWSKCPKTHISVSQLLCNILN